MSGNLMVEMQLHSVRAGHTAPTHSKAALSRERIHPTTEKQPGANETRSHQLWRWQDFTSSLQPSARLPLLPLTDNLAPKLDEIAVFF